MKNKAILNPGNSFTDDDADDEVSQVRSVDLHLPLKNHTVSCHTPLGDELVDSKWLDEPTRVIPAAEMEVLVKELKRQTRLEENKHHRLTVREMRAVDPEQKKKKEKLK